MKWGEGIGGGESGEKGLHWMVGIEEQGGERIRKASGMRDAPPPPPKKVHLGISIGVFQSVAFRHSAFFLAIIVGRGGGNGMYMISPFDISGGHSSLPDQPIF